MAEVIEKFVQHTPGPWVVESDGNYPIVRKRFRPDHHMDVCGPVHGYMYAEDEKGEQRANAHLIAAAPEMYEALKAADDALAQFTAFEYSAREIMGNTNFELVKLRREQVRAALAKAEGR